MHGAALRVPPDATAFSRREKSFNVSALAIWEDAAGDADHIAWARRTAAALQKRSTSGGGYLTTELRMSPSNACARPTATRTSSGCGR